MKSVTHTTGIPCGCTPAFGLYCEEQRARIRRADALYSEIVELTEDEIRVHGDFGRESLAQQRREIESERDEVLAQIYDHYTARGVDCHAEVLRVHDVLSRELREGRIAGALLRDSTGRIVATIGEEKTADTATVGELNHDLG